MHAFINYKLKGFKEWVMIGMLKGAWYRRKKRHHLIINERNRQRIRLTFNFTAAIGYDKTKRECIKMVSNFIMFHVDHFTLI